MSELSMAVDGLGQIQHRGAELSSFDAMKRKRAVVSFRRELAGQIAKISLAISQDPYLLNNTLLAAEFRTRLSRVRHEMALHQAEWPAVVIDPDSEAYIRSLAKTRQCNRDFVTWVRTVLPVGKLIGEIDRDT